MQSEDKSYPFGKSMMLNVVYDTLERLGACVTSSNSERGRIQFQVDGIDLVLKIDTIYPQETVQVTVASETVDLDCDFTNALFDEIDSTISTIRTKK